MRGVIALVLLAVVLDTGCDRPAKEQRAIEQRVELPREVQVIQTLRINESETVKVLAVPDPMLSGEPSFDTRCLIYTNQDLRQTVIKCPSRGLSGPDTH